MLSFGLNHNKKVDYIQLSNSRNEITASTFNLSVGPIYKNLYSFISKMKECSRYIFLGKEIHNFISSIHLNIHQNIYEKLSISALTIDI